MFIAAWASDIDFECYRDDDRNHDDISDLASPVGVILRVLDDASIERVKAMAVEEWAASHDDEDPMPKCEWQTSAFGDAGAVFVLMTDKNELYGMIVISERTVI